MEKRIATRVVDTGGAATNTLLNREASDVHWISYSPEVIGTQGLIQIYDGFDAAGKLVWQLEPGYARQHCFYPPIPCEQGVFVATDANMASYTIAWRPRKWDRPTTHPEDVITHPEA